MTVGENDLASAGGESLASDGTAVSKDRRRRNHATHWNREISLDFSIRPIIYL